MAGDDVYGKLTAYNLERRRFSDDDRRLFTSLARRAALAIENARLFEQSQRQTQQLSALYRADEELHRSLQLDDVLQGLISTVRDTFDADGVAAVVWEPGDARPRFMPYEPMSEELVDARGQQPGADRPRELHRPAVGRPRLRRHVGIAAGGATTELRRWRQSAHRSPAAGERPGHRPCRRGLRATRKFPQEEQRLLGALALRAEVAIDNARLYGSAQTLAAVEERQRLARRTARLRLASALRDRAWRSHGAHPPRPQPGTSRRAGRLRSLAGRGGPRRDARPHLRTAARIAGTGRPGRGNRKASRLHAARATALQSTPRSATNRTCR